MRNFKTESDIPALIPKLTYRESKYVKARILGATEGDALRSAGFPEYLALTPSRFPNIDALREMYEKCKNELALNTIVSGLIDAVEIHEQLTDELRGDIADLYKDDGDLKPVREWPQWARAGGVEVLDEPNIVHSSDGENSSWDVQGRRIKVKMGSRHKSRELAAKLKGVNALVEQKQGDINLHVHTEQVTAKLQGALKRQARLIEAETVKKLDE